MKISSRLSLLNKGKKLRSNKVLLQFAVLFRGDIFCVIDEVSYDMQKDLWSEYHLSNQISAPGVTIQKCFYAVFLLYVNRFRIFSKELLLYLSLLPPALHCLQHFRAYPPVSHQNSWKFSAINIRYRFTSDIIPQIAERSQIFSVFEPVSFRSSTPPRSNPGFDDSSRSHAHTFVQLPVNCRTAPRSCFRILRSPGAALAEPAHDRACPTVRGLGAPGERCHIPAGPFPLRRIARFITAEFQRSSTLEQLYRHVDSLASLQVSSYRQRHSIQSRFCAAPLTREPAQRRRIQSPHFRADESFQPPLPPRTILNHLLFHEDAFSHLITCL